MKTSFYICATSKAAAGNDVTEYIASAGEMKDAFEHVLTDTETMSTILKGAILTCHTQAEIGWEDDCLSGKAVIDIEAEGKCTLDKTKLSAALKKNLQWKDVKIEKKTMQTADLDVAAEDSMPPHAATDVPGAEVAEL